MEDILPPHWGSNPRTSVCEANAVPLTPQQSLNLIYCNKRHEVAKAEVYSQIYMHTYIQNVFIELVNICAKLKIPANNLNNTKNRQTFTMARTKSFDRHAIRTDTKKTNQPGNTNTIQRQTIHSEIIWKGL